MKKVLALLIVCALVAPAFAGDVTLSSVDNEDGTATVSMTVVAGDLVGIGLDVTTISGELDDVEMAIPEGLTLADIFLNIFIDKAYDEEQPGEDGYTYGEGTSPVCLVPGPGSTTVAEANTAGIPFALCVGGLGGAAKPLMAGPTTGDTVEVFVFSAENGATAEVTLNVIRGGIVDKDATAMTTDLPLTVTITNGPACWGWASQCYGATDVDDNNVDIDDFLLFKAAFGSSEDGTNGPAANYNPCADYDREGDVDIDDFLIFKAGFAITTVPSDC